MERVISGREIFLIAPGTVVYVIVLRLRWNRTGKSGSHHHNSAALADRQVALVAEQGWGRAQEQVKNKSVCQRQGHEVMHKEGHGHSAGNRQVTLWLSRRAGAILRGSGQNKGPFSLFQTQGQPHVLEEFSHQTTRLFCLGNAAPSLTSQGVQCEFAG